MIKKTSLILALACTAFRGSGAAECLDAPAPSNPQFLLDGGSVKITLQRKCGVPSSVEAIGGLHAKPALAVNGVHLRAGSREERQILKELDSIISHKWPLGAPGEIAESEMRRKSGGLEYAAVIGIIEASCLRKETLKQNRGLCAKYLKAAP